MREGRLLAGLATAMLDVSDGLDDDLRKLLVASGVGAELDAGELPLSGELRSVRGTQAVECALTGGDDYELCFTVPSARHAEVLRIGAQLDLPLTCIGKIVAGRICIVHDASGNPINVETSGYDHFR